MDVIFRNLPNINTPFLFHLLSLIDFFNKRKADQGAQAKIAELEAKLAEQNNTTDVNTNKSEDNEKQED